MNLILARPTAPEERTAHASNHSHTTDDGAPPGARLRAGINNKTTTRRMGFQKKPQQFQKKPIVIMLLLLDLDTTYVAAVLAGVGLALTLVFRPRHARAAGLLPADPMAALMMTRKVFRAEPSRAKPIRADPIR